MATKSAESTCIPTCTSTLPYLLEADEADELRDKPDENSGVKWFSLDDAVAASVEPWMQRRVYEKLNAKLRAGWER